MFFYPESEQLKPLILCYWIIETSGIPHNTKMMPDGYSDIMLNQGAAYTICKTDGTKEQITKSSVFGQRTQHLLLQQPGDVNMIGIRLKPGSESVFFNNAVSLLVNHHIPLQELVSVDLSETEKQTFQSSDADHKISLVEKMLLAVLDAKTGKKKSDQINPVISDLIAAFTPDCNLETLFTEQKISYKQAERSFKKHLGLTPKQYFRVLRFYKAFTQMREKYVADWMTILHANGYYDQAHFIKDFRFFTGQSPSRQKSLKDSLDDFFNL